MKNWKNWVMVILGVLVVTFAMLFIDAQYMRHSQWEQGYQELQKELKIKEREKAELQETLRHKEFDVRNAANQNDESGINYWKGQFENQKQIAETKQKMVQERNKTISALKKQIIELGATPVTDKK